MFPILLKLGPLTLHTYGLLVALGIFTGIKLCARAAARDGFTGKTIEDSLNQMAFHMVIAGLLGARIFYVILQWPEFSQNLMDVFKIWQGGLVSYGGLIGATVGLCVWNRSKPFEADWRQIADWTAPSLAFGHAIGRLGCFTAGCCYGKITDLPWGVIFIHPDSLAILGFPLHPTQIYESLFLGFLGAYLLWRLSKLRQNPNRTHGSVFIDYLLIYSAGRFLIEFFRQDDPRRWGLTPGQITSLVILSLTFPFVLKRMLSKNVR